MAATVMNNALPDELVKEILSLNLRVPDEMFEDTSEPSIFCRFEGGSTSALLVVCKQWLRVATPLLYETLVLRSKAQAQALARVLVNNPVLGTFVRKIRLEGGYGVAAQKILLAVPHMSDIFLRMPIPSNDSSTGLVKTLHHISPKRAILYHARDMRIQNKQNKALQVALTTCIEHHWDQLTSVSYTYNPYSNHDFSRAMRASQSLKHITVPDITYTSLRWCHVISENPSIECIKVCTSPSPHMQNEIYKSERLASLLELPERHPPFTQKHPVLGYGRNFVPMASVPEAVRRKVWTRIIEWVAQMHENSSADYSTARWDVPSRRYLGRHLLQIMRLSKFFLSVARPILFKYARIHLLTSRGHAFIRRLQSESALRGSVHSLFIEPDHVSLERGTPIVEMINLIELTPNLVGLYGLPRERGGWTTRPNWTCTINWKGFELLAQTAGHSLSEMLNVEITVSAHEGSQSPMVFRKFDNLHTLQWKSEAEFMDSPKTLTRIENCLPNLDRLSFELYDESFITVVAAMRLPALKRVVFPVLEKLSIPFFRSHGSKIIDLRVEETSRFPIFDLCPNLKTVTIGGQNTIPDPTFFSSKQSHRCLTRIVVANYKKSRFRQDKLPKDEEAGWSTFFELLDLGSFPALREIQMYRAVWPTDEYQMQKNPWWRWVEGVMEEWNVSFNDAKGTRWRPRLKASSARRERTYS